MNIDISPRASGKTSRMIEWARSSKNHVVITFSVKERDRLRDYHADLKDRIFSWEEWQQVKYGNPHDIRVGVDNADLIIQQMVMRDIDRISLSSKNSNEKNALNRNY